MSDDLALSVGKIILAWGRLDQNVHISILGLQNFLKEPFSKEGRFSERRKILRRLCMRLARNDAKYERAFDRVCAQLIRLERKRGRIAHGHAGSMKDTVLFLNFAEVFAGGSEPEKMLLENSFSFDELGTLETEIEDCAKAIIRLSLDALRLWRQGTQPTPQQ